MKRYSLLLLFAALLTFSAAAQRTDDAYAPIPHHESVPSNPAAAAAMFARQINQIAPYYASQYSLTIITARVNKNNQSVLIEIRLDADQTIRPEKEYYLSLFAEADRPWDLTLLADNGYGLTLQVTTDMTNHNLAGYGGLKVTLTNSDLRSAVGTAVDVDRMGHDYLVSYARNVSARLPMAMGKDEQFVQCYFVDSTLTMTLEYQDSAWPGIRQYLLQNMDNIRISRAMALVDDTTNALAISAKLSKSQIRHVYRNHSLTDSVFYVITPWMLDYVYEKTMQRQNDQSSPTGYLMALAAQLERQTPIRVDKETRLMQCTYDTVERLMTITYEIPDSVMLRFETSLQLFEEFGQNMKTYFKSQDPQVATMVKNLIAADATIRYVYGSAYRRQPLILTFTASDLSQILAQ